MDLREQELKAAMFYGLRDLRVENVPDPGPPGPGEVLAKVRAATTCGTDLKRYTRGHVLAHAEGPSVFGHEWAGDVLEVGEGVTKFKKGMRVTSGNTVPCFQCEYCKTGRYSICPNKTSYGTGTYAEFLKIPAPLVTHVMFEIPKNLTYEEAACIEPFACPIHGLDQTPIKIADKVAIIGAGPIGLMWLQLVKRAGAAKVISIDTVDFRLQVAKKLGADEIINAKDQDPEKRVKELTNGYGAEVVVEAVGTPQTWEEAFKLVKRGGFINEFAGCAPGATMTVNCAQLHYDEITVRGSFHCNSHIDFKRALDYMASGFIDMKSLITRKMPLDEVNKAFEILTTSRNELKIALIP